MKNPASIHFHGELREYHDPDTGELEHSENHISIDGKRLELAKSLAIRNHSPDGFNWGYGGSGPAQTALAICLELYGEEIAKQVYQNFKWQFIAGLPPTDKIDIVIKFPPEWRERIQNLISGPEYYHPAL